MQQTNIMRLNNIPPMILQLYMLLTSNILQLNAVLSLDNGLSKDLLGGVLYAILF